MVFAILAFIGFEASAPLGEEAKNPRRTVPRAVVGSALAIGIFYVLCSYAWVFGAGFNNFVAAGDRRRPVAEPRQGVLGHRLGRRVPRDLQLDRGELERGDERRDARVLCARAQRARTASRSDARTRSFKTPYDRDHLAVGFALVLSLLVGWKWEPGCRLRDHRDARGDRSSCSCTCSSAVGSIVYYLRQAPRRVQSAPAPDPADRRDRAVLLPALLPVLQGTTRRIRTSTRTGSRSAYTSLGIVVTIGVVRSRPERLARRRPRVRRRRDARDADRLMAAASPVA